MRNDDPQLIEALSAEYVLGTLRGRARARLERWRATSPPIDAAIHAWENRLVHLALATPAVTPAVAVWRAIERRIDGARRARSPSQWRALAAVVALCLIVGAAFFAWRIEQARTLQTFATIAQPSGAPLWRIEVSSDYERLQAVALGPVGARPDKSLELWALPDSGKAPVSLGLLPERGRLERRLTEAQQSALRAASRVAVSLEPTGGSPTGAPTGPVLFVASRAAKA